MDHFDWTEIQSGKTRLLPIRSLTYRECFFFSLNKRIALRSHASSRNAEIIVSRVYF